MFFIISKLLAFITTPVIWIFALLLFTLFSKDEKRRRKLFIWTVVIFYVFSNSFLFDECMRLWEIPATNGNLIDKPFDAGIVLGGVISYDPVIDRIQFAQQADRIQQAILLYKKGKIKKIVFTGGSGSLEFPEIKEGLYIKKYLTDIDIPDSAIIIESESRNTRQNALFTKTLLDKNFHDGRFLLITSASHERRSIKCFEKVGISVTPYSVDRYSGPRKFVFDHVFIPNAKTLYDWDALMHEVVGLLIYKLAGYA